MKQLSYWAKFHPRTTWLIIILLYLPLNILGIATGLLLYDFNVSLGISFIYPLISITCLLFLIEQKKAPYHIRKLLHLSMAICTYLLLVFAGNQVHQPNPYFPFSLSVNAVGTASLTTSVSQIEQTKESKLAKKLNRKETKKRLKKTEETGKGLPLWAKILFIVLVVVVAVGLFYLLAALACTITCNGAEALAVVVAIAGTFGIVFGAFLLIQAILGKKRKKKRTSASGD